MRKKIKLSFEALERELSKVNSNEMLNVLGGTGNSNNPNDSYITQLASYIDSKISLLESNKIPGVYNSYLEDAISSLRSMKTSFNSLKNDTTFTISSGNGASDSFSFNFDGNSNVSMAVSFNSSGTTEEKMAKLGHELTHVLQWKNNEVGYILPTGNEQTTAPIALDNYDRGDELKAFQNMAILQFGDNYFANKADFTNQFNNILDDPFYSDKFTHTEYPVTTVYDGN